MSLRALFPYFAIAPLFTGCINVPDIVDAAPDGGDVNPSDGGQVDLTVSHGATHFRGPVVLQINTNVLQPDKVELVIGDELLASLQPPYTYTWDTTAFPEGAYALAARVIKNGRVEATVQRQFVVDRTPPTIVSREPSPDAGNVQAGQPIRVRISEPVLDTTVNSSSVRVRLGGILVERTIELTENATLLTITPTETGRLPHSFELALAETITDLAGNPLDISNGTWSWIVPAWLSVGSATGIEPPGARLPHLHVKEGSDPLITSMTRNGVFVHRLQDGQWNRIGDMLKVAIDGINVSGSAPVVQSYNDTPFVSWSEEEREGGSTYVRAWSGNAWQDVGSAVFGTGRPSLQFGAEAQPWLAVAQEGPEQGATSVHVRQLNGSQWQDVGSPFRAVTTSLRRVSDLSLGVHDGVPHIAWAEFELGEQEAPVDGRIHVWRRVSTEWIPMGGALNAHPSGTSASQTDLKLDGGGRPLVAWSESGPPESGDAAARIYVRRWDGSQWIALGSGLSATPGSTPAEFPSLALASDGTPLIAWKENDGSTDRVHVRRWSGAEWETFEGTPSAVPGIAHVGSLHLQVDEDDIPWIACEARAGDGHQRIFVYRFNR